MDGPTAFGSVWVAYPSVNNSKERVRGNYSHVTLSNFRTLLSILSTTVSLRQTTGVVFTTSSLPERDHRQTHCRRSFGGTRHTPHRIQDKDDHAAYNVPEDSSYSKSNSHLKQES